MKIRLKLTLLFGVVVAAILLIFSFSIYYFYSLFREIEFYERLKDKAFETVELLTEVKTIDQGILKIIDKHDLTTLYGEEVIMFDLNFNTMYKSGEEYLHFPQSLLKEIFAKKEIRLRNGDRETIGVLVQEGKNSYIVVVSAIDKFGYSKLDNLILILSIGWSLSVGLVFLIGYFFSENALHPISVVIKQVDKITASNLNTRVDEGNGKDEIAQLGKTFNNMLNRIEDAFIMQKNFVSNASHELRTPMTAISGQIEVALMQKRSEEEYQKTMLSILEDVRKLTKMTNGLLELAKISSDEYGFRPEKQRIDDLIWQTRSDLLKKHPDFTVKVDFENFPEEEDNLYILGKENLLMTAFINLMENACKFSTNKTVNVLIIIFFNKIQILFMDNGIGISKEDLPFIFQPFYRSSQTRKVSGYGVGLSIVERIIRLHKGIIEVNSAENVGTIFTVTLYKNDANTSRIAESITTEKK